MKQCSRCGEVKAEVEFYAAVDRRSGAPRIRLMAKCKACHGAVAQDWKRRNRERARAIDSASKARRLFHRKLRTYGLDELELLAMETSQQGHCLICGDFVGEALVIDHDHTTGEVRGLLCTGCNVGLGAFRDDPRRLLRAIAYLKVGALWTRNR